MCGIDATQQRKGTSCVIRHCFLLCVPSTFSDVNRDTKTKRICVIKDIKTETKYRKKKKTEIKTKLKTYLTMWQTCRWSHPRTTLRLGRLNFWYTSGVHRSHLICVATNLYVPPNKIKKRRNHKIKKIQKIECALIFSSLVTLKIKR